MVPNSRYSFWLAILVDLAETGFGLVSSAVAVDLELEQPMLCSRSGARHYA